MNELKTVVLIYIKCQSLLHSIDDLSDKPIFKQWLKRQTNRYIKDLERFIRDLEPALSNEEGDMFVSLVNELDKIDEQILKNIEIDATKVE